MNSQFKAQGKQTSKIVRWAFVMIICLLAGSVSQATVLLTDDFNGSSIDGAKWTVNTTLAYQSDPLPSVVEQNGQAAFWSTGMLITKDQYDPSTLVDPVSGLRGLLITGQWTVGAPSNGATTEDLSVLTGKNLSLLWGGLDFHIYGQLDAFTMLYITAQTPAGAINEVINATAALGAISTGTTYDFTIRDQGPDGLSFTVANAANPTTTATVTANFGVWDDTYYNSGYVAFFNNTWMTSSLDNVTFSTIVPEPATVVLLGLGAGLAYWRRKIS